MPKGGIRPRSSDGSLDHLLKPKWKQGRTRTIRVPVVLAEQLLELAHRLDEGELLELRQDKKTEGDSHPVDLTQDSKTEDGGTLFELTQDNNTEEERIKADLAKAIALLQNAITPKSKGGSYAANNATGIKRLVEQALALLGSEGDARPVGPKKHLDATSAPDPWNPY